MPELPEAAWSAARKLYVSDPGMEVFEFEAMLDAPDDPRLAPPAPPAPKPRPTPMPPTPRPARPARPHQPFDVRGALVVLGFMAVIFYIAPLIAVVITVIAVACAVAVRL
jgi:hypothetical protein